VRISREEPGFVVSAAVHAGLLLTMLVLLSDARKFEDAQEAVPVDVLTDSQFNQIMKGEKSARAAKTPRVDRVADETETKAHPPLAEAKKDVPTPPPPLKRRADPGEDDKADPPTPPKRLAALPPPASRPPEPPRPEPKPEAKPEAKPAPTPPAKPKAAAPAPPEKAEPEEAEVVKPKPPTRPKPEKEAREAPTPPKPEKPAKETPKPKPRLDKPRLETDEAAKILRQATHDAKPDRNAKQAVDAEGDPADKPVKTAKPKSGDETAPKSKFSTSDIANLLSREAPQRRASTGRELSRTAALGAPTGSAAKMSASLQGRIDSYTVDHYRRCWVSALAMNALTYVPRVEFRLTRSGALEGAPRLLNPSSNPVEKARGEQALAAVRRCSPMPIPPEFEPYYDYWRVTALDMKENM